MPGGGRFDASLASAASYALSLSFSSSLLNPLDASLFSEFV
jgi:hypothetical protein